MQQARVETWLWLANALGYAPAHALDILERYENPEELVTARFQQESKQWFTTAQHAALCNKEPEDFISRVALCAEKDVQIVTYDDPDYPQLLRTIESAPPVLYYRGDITLLNTCVTFAIVGTRRPSAYGVQATQVIAKGLAESGVVLVSGLATGLDSECHKAAIRSNVPTVACIAFSHEHCYPAGNKKMKELIERTGLVISEYPPDEIGVQKPFFLQRNRLIAGISQGICVAEARSYSGTMNTVTHALNFGRDVFSVPGSIFSTLSEGTNRLILDGATPVTCAKDILNFYKIEIELQPERCDEKQRQPLSPNAAAVLKLLLSTPQPVEVLCTAMKLSAPVVMAALTELELAGYCEQQAGRQFALKQ